MDIKSAKRGRRCISYVVLAILLPPLAAALHTVCTGVAEV